MNDIVLNYGKLKLGAFLFVGRSPGHVQVTLHGLRRGGHEEVSAAAAAFYCLLLVDITQADDTA
jgi:hypothetical protein